MDNIIEIDFIKDFPNYLISNTGLVYSIKNDKLLKPQINHDGYLRVDLSKNGKRHHKYIHRLVGETYLEQDETRPEIDHIDRNPRNNHINNLRWVNKSENALNRNPRRKTQEHIIKTPQHILQMIQDIRKSYK